MLSVKISSHSAVALRLRQLADLAEVEQEGKFMYYVYALYNGRHNKIYIGQTENLEERLRLHRNKLFVNSFTAKLDGEWILIYKESVIDRKQALLREKQLKSYRGREFIKQFIPR